jgi:hypothetical protein
MSTVADDTTRIEPVERLLLRAASGPLENLALLTWADAVDEGFAVQVYVDGQLHDIVADGRRGECWLWLDRRQVHHVHALRVPAGVACIDHASHLPLTDEPFAPHASITLLRDEALPVDAAVTITLDGQPVDRQPLWSADDARNGWGGLHGIGSFGHDLATGPGLGLESHGHGPFGSGSHPFHWTSRDLDPLAPGPHTLDITITDAAGRSLASSTLHLTIDPPPPPPRDLSIDDTDDDTTFTLHWH